MCAGVHVWMVLTLYVFLEIVAHLLFVKITIDYNHLLPNSSSPKQIEKPRTK
jgi:hypothetical protein